MRTIVTLLGAAVLCACGGVDPGTACTSESECGDRLDCIAIDAERSACMLPCDEGTRLCNDGSVCLESPSNGRVCWFGGGVPFGRACEGPLSCEPGAVCHAGLCEQACSLAAPAGFSGTFDPSAVCDDHQTCEAAASEPAGVCLPSIARQDGGVALRSR